MNGLWKSGILQICGTANAALQQTNYRVLIIEEEKVPLASGDLIGGHGLFPVALIIMALLFFGTLLTVYYFRCRQYRYRLMELGGSKMAFCGRWNLKKLKEKTVRMEWNLAGEEEQPSL